MMDGNVLRSSCDKHSVSAGCYTLTSRPLKEPGFSLCDVESAAAASGTNENTEQQYVSASV